MNLHFCGEDMLQLAFPQPVLLTLTDSKLTISVRDGTGGVEQGQGHRGTGCSELQAEVEQRPAREQHVEMQAIASLAGAM